MVVDASGVAEPWTPDFDELLGLDWEPAGNSFLFTGARKGSLDYIWRARRGREPELVYAAPANLLLTDISREGRVLVIQSDWRQEVEVCTPDGGQRSLEWLDWGLLGAISRDGTKVLMAENGKGALGASALLLRDISQPAPVKLAVGPPLALSPDGRWAITLDNAERQNLVMIPTGPGEPRQLPPSGLARIDRAAFFPDGRRLALIGLKTPGAPSQVFLYDSKTGETRVIAPEGTGDSAVVSPDEQRVAAVGPDGFITAYTLDGKQSFRVDSWDASFRLVGWLEDGSLVAHQPYVLPSRVERYDPRTRKVSLLRTISPIDPAGVAAIVRARITPDGRTIAFQLRRMSAVLTVLDWDGPPP